MDPSFHSTGNNSISLRIAVSPRLIATLSYSMAALGASLSGFLLFRVLRAMRDAESAGIGLLVFSVWPRKSNSQAKWPGTLALVIIQVVLIATTICFPDAHVLVVARDGSRVVWLTLWQTKNSLTSKLI